MIKKILFKKFLANASLLLCLQLTFSSASLNAQQIINGSIMHDGGERNYILYVPQSYEESNAVPLVFSFHGYGSQASIHFSYTDFNSIADTAGFIVVYPQGSLLLGLTHWNVGGWTIGSTVDDVDFTNALLDTISFAYNINEDRVFSVGMSNGGYMSFLLACQLSDRFAAVASVTGSMTPQMFANCNPQHPTPILQIHGTSDGTVPYNGNPVWTKSIEDVLAYWRNYNNCTITPTITAIPDIHTSDGSTVDHFTYADGDKCVSTEHFKVYGGNHDWPGAFGNMDIDASAEIWNFFRQYDINGRIDCTISSVDDQTLNHPSFQINPNPALDVITVTANLDEATPFKIHSSAGMVVQKGMIQLGKTTLDISNLSPQSYIMVVGNQRLPFIKL